LWLRRYQRSPQLSQRMAVLGMSPSQSYPSSTVSTPTSSVSVNRPTSHVNSLFHSSSPSFATTTPPPTAAAAAITTTTSAALSTTPHSGSANNEVVPRPNVLSVTDYAATITWMPPKNGGPYTSYRLHRTLGAIPQQDRQQIIYEGPLLLYLDKDVQSDATYSYCVSAYSESGWTKSSEPLTIEIHSTNGRLLDFIPPPPDFENISSTSIQLVWDACGIDARMFQLLCASNSSTIHTNAAVIYEGSRLSFVHNNLKPDTDYTYALVIMEGKATSKLGRSATARTLPSSLLV